VANHYVGLAEKRGTFPDLEVTASSLEAFFQDHDPRRSGDEARAMAASHEGKTALLVRALQHKYKGKSPAATKRKPAVDPAAETAGVGGAGGSVQLQLVATADLEAELTRRKAGGGGDDGGEDAVAAAEAASLALFSTVASGVRPAERCVVVGGGPAGLSAAIYAARAGLEPLVLAPSFGGQLLGKGVDVENYPAVVGEQASGKGIIHLMRAQVKSRGTDRPRRPLCLASSTS
jgi:hypothetical protein